ncbi:methyltransferase [Actinomadura sp. NTSP31]|uniref:methyltransferase n=1 Tax=Actinomadura sp. NTSP31 TaxID=1735447 RepID=UPI0035C20585
MMPPELENAIYGMLATPVLRTAEKHGVFARLIEGGPAGSEKLAGDLGLDRDTLERMMLLLTALRVLDLGDAGDFRVPAAVRPYLDRREPLFVGGFLEHLAEETSARLGRLDGYLKEGRPAEAAAPFGEVYRDEETMRAFMTAMWDLSYGASTELVTLAGLDGTARLVDVGGATGPFSVAALRAAPRLRAVVFDLPAIRPLAEETAHAHGLADRLEFAGGDFFTDELPAGDCLAFGYILSDWDDETCVELLAKAHRACTAPGRVLIMDRLFADDRTGPPATAAMNLVMHLEMAGRHRTAAEFAALLERAGFTDCEVRRSGGEKHLIVGHKNRR